MGALHPKVLTWDQSFILTCEMLHDIYDLDGHFQWCDLAQKVDYQLIFNSQRNFEENISHFAVNIVPTDGEHLQAQ